MTSASTVKLAGAIALLLALLFSFGLRLWWMNAAPPLPELLQGLGDSEKAENQAAFERRLTERFPPGSSEAALVEALRDQGFRIDFARKEAAFDRPAGFEDPCRRGGSTRWSVDAAGRIAELSGGYYIHCP